MKAIPTPEAEAAALTAAMALASSVRRMPGAVEHLLAHGREEAADRALRVAPRAPGPGAIVLCLIDRGPLVMPGNVRDCCADCGIPVQKRPDVPAHTVPVCAICCVARMKE